jgi:hypothetical protein
MTAAGRAEVADPLSRGRAGLTRGGLGRVARTIFAVAFAPLQVRGARCSPCDALPAPTISFRGAQATRMLGSELSEQLARRLREPAH